MMGIEQDLEMLNSLGKKKNDVQAVGKKWLTELHRDNGKFNANNPIIMYAELTKNPDFIKEFLLKLLANGAKNAMQTIDKKSDFLDIIINEKKNSKVKIEYAFFAETFIEYAKKLPYYESQYIETWMMSYYGLSMLTILLNMFATHAKIIYIFNYNKTEKDPRLFLVENHINMHTKQTKKIRFVYIEKKTFRDIIGENADDIMHNIYEIPGYANYQMNAKKIENDEE